MSAFPPGAVLTADSLPPGTVQWGIFDQFGNPVLTADSVFSLEYSRDYRISDYPQEMGAFESYNKVQTPFSAKLTFAIQQTRPDFFGQVETAAQALDLVSVITPDVSYPSANVVHYGYRRQKENADLVLVDVWVEEVRVLATSSTFNTQDPTGNAPTTPNAVSPNAAPQNNDGVVKASPPTSPSFQNFAPDQPF